MGIILALSAAFLNAFFQVVMKLLGRVGKNAWIYASAYQILAGLIMLVYALTEPAKFSTDATSLVLLVIAWICWLFTGGFNYMAVSKLDVSVNVILAQVALVISYIGAVIFFGDKVTWLRIVGAVMVIGATVIIFAKKNSFLNINKKGVAYRMVGSTAFAFAGLLDKNNLNNYSMAIYMALAYLVPGVIAGFVGRVSLKEYVSEVKKTWKYIVGLSLISVGAYYAMLQSFKYIEASLSFTLLNFMTVITVFIGVIFFKERSDMIRKIIALVIVLIAAYLLNIS